MMVRTVEKQERDVEMIDMVQGTLKALSTRTQRDIVTNNTFDAKKSTTKESDG
jgi:hypothetical protein